MDEKEKRRYMKSGQAGGGMVMLSLIVGVGIAIVVLIFLMSLAGQTYEMVEDDIDDITNSTIKESVKASIVSGFEAGEKTADYMKLLVLASVIGVILLTVLGVTAVFNRPGAGGGSAL